MRSAHAPPAETGRRGASARLRKVYPHPESEYAPISGTVHHKNPTSTPFLLLRRDFEDVGSGATTFQTSSINGKAEERLAMMNSIAREISRQLRGRKAASFLGSREVEDSEVAGHHHQSRCSCLGGVCCRRTRQVGKGWQKVTRWHLRRNDFSHWSPLHNLYTLHPRKFGKLSLLTGTASATASFSSSTTRRLDSVLSSSMESLKCLLSDRFRGVWPLLAFGEMHRPPQFAVFAVSCIPPVVIELHVLLTCSFQVQ